jgi:hypothetical protein|nr:MAG TPA: hypothetical protein [Caudoviricetes sp.]
MKIEKTIVTDDGKRFSVGDEIAFRRYNCTTCYIDRYIGEITKIRDRSMELKDVEVNRSRVTRNNETFEILYDSILTNSYNYVYSEES